MATAADTRVVYDGNSAVGSDANRHRALRGDNATVTLTDTSLARTGTTTLTLATIETANLTGGAGNTIIDASAFTLGAVTLDGQGGNDTITGARVRTS